jgi:hypothetical protein
MLFKEITPVYTDKHMKPINTNADLLIVKSGGTGIYRYHWAPGVIKTTFLFLKLSSKKTK